MVSREMSLKLERGKKREENKNDWRLDDCAAHDWQPQKVEGDLMLEKAVVVFDLQI